MKQQIPINTTKEGIAPTITSHYHKAGESDFIPRQTNEPTRHLAILEIEMEEPKPIQVAQIYDQEQNPMNGRVYSEDGIAPTLRTPTGGLSEPKIMQIGSYVPNSKDAGKVVDADGIAPTVMENHGCPTAIVEPAILTPIRTEKAKELRRQGIETFANRELVPRQDGISNCLTSVTKDNLLQEQVIGSMQANAMRGSVNGVSPCLTEAMGKGGGQISMIVQLGHGYNPGGIKNGDVSPAITTSSWESNNMLVEPCGCYDNQSGEFARAPLEGVARTVNTDHHNAVGLRYRVRKLTPREVYRLQDVDDADIDKLFAYRIKTTLKNGTVKEKPIPKSRHYALAGNSITVSPLYFIFKAMFIDEPPKAKPAQKSLFDI